MWPWMAVPPLEAGLAHFTIPVITPKQGMHESGQADQCRLAAKADQSFHDE